MGMDVYGNNPTGKKGEYFCNQIHYWEALADYIHAVAPTIAAKCTYWCTNDGDDLEVLDALALADALQKEIDSGRCETYAKDQNKHWSARKRHPGERTWPLGHSSWRQRCNCPAAERRHISFPRPERAEIRCLSSRMRRLSNLVAP